MPAEVGLVGEDTEGSGTVLLVGKGDGVCASVLLDPALRGGAAFELGNDAGIRGQQGSTE